MTASKIYVGTSGFAYDAWVGRFYPKELPKSRMLEHYATRFDTCEINNTFYRMPSAAMTAAWAGKVPKGFSFVLKASLKFTNLKRIAENEASVREFFVAHAALGDAAGPVLVQLPPHFQKDVAILERFLALVPKKAKIAFDLGSPTWRSPDVYEAMRMRDCALVCVDDVDEKKSASFEPVGSFGYVRLRRTKYTKRALELWASRIKEVEAWRSAYVVFKHDDEATGPLLGKAFQRNLAPKGGGISRG